MLTPMKMTLRKLPWNGYWQLDYRDTTGRKRPSFGTRAEAVAEFERLRDLWASGLAVVAEMDDAEAHDLAAVLLEMKKVNVTPRQVWERWKASVAGAAKGAAPIGQVITECLDALNRAGRRPAYVRMMRYYLSLFAKGREMLPIHQVSPQMIREWFAGRSETPQCRMANQARLHRLLAFAVKQGYCEVNCASGLERPSIDHRPPRILAPDEAAGLLRFARERAPEFLAHLALGLFAGIRPEELRRLRWESVDLAAGQVDLGAAVSKVRRRRLVPLHPTAVAWLRLANELGHGYGSIFRGSSSKLRRRYRAALDEVSLRSERRDHTDIFRHSAASYLMALHRDAGKVAEMLGNSPTVLLTRYRELVKPADCEAFWALTPAAIEPRPAT